MATFELVQSKAKKLSPILKWAGGKEQELKYILPKVPTNINNYYEPFVGGGSVYTAIQAKKYFINDKSEELISLYSNIKGTNRQCFFNAIEEIIHNWDLLTLVVENNYNFFIETYKEYSRNGLSEARIRQIMLGFIITNAAEFNGMFSETFNFNTANFLKELQINLFRKIKRMKQLEGLKGLLSNKDIIDNLETALKSAFYMHFRHIYNNTENYQIASPIRSAIFLFIRNFAYSGMFRYNARGQFNVPYGGIGYNRKNFRKKIEYLKGNDLKELLKLTTIENLDFEAFLMSHDLNWNDFVFLDPPYDSEFSTYAQNEFTQQDQMRLANCLLQSSRAKWMMVIKNTPLISGLYLEKGLNVYSFDKTYLVSFMNRNDKDAEHLLITNY
jgi:DNA adenine methylase